MQEDMVFSDIGKWFVGKYRKILQRHGMADVLEADWVLTPGKAESLDENNPDQINTLKLSQNVLICILNAQKARMK